MDTAVLDTLERIAVTQLVIAISVAVIALIAIGGAVVLLLELRAAHQLLRSVGSRINQIAPQLGPVMERMKDASDDIAGMTADARRRMDDVLHTVEDLHRAVKRAGAATEERIRRFDAVLDVVQTEAEELMLDAAATAHGVHEAARSLRGSSSTHDRTGRTASTTSDHEEEMDHDATR